jgi:hypothetical protein
MFVAGGGLCVGVSRAALNAAGVAVDDDVELVIAPASSTASKPHQGFTGRAYG